jgi:hypothetical protein
LPSRRNFLSLAAALLPFDVLGSPQLGVTLRIIVVKTRPEADDIQQKLAAGESFEKLARQFSIVPSAKDGGYIGSLDPTTLPREIQQALKGVAPGQFTQPVETHLGFAILRIMTAAEAATLQGGGAGMGAAGQKLNYMPVTNVSGLSEATGFFLRLPKPPNYQQDLQVNCQAHTRAVVGGIQQIESDLATMPPGSPGEQLARFTLGQMYSFQGNFGKAIQQFQMANDIRPTITVSGDEVVLEKVLGITELWRAEMENSIYRQDARKWNLPLDRNSPFRLTGGSENAIQHLLKCLDQNPDDHEGKWLLNVAQMSLGKYPENVPARHLIETGLVKSKESIGRFVDLAPALKLDVLAQSGSVAIDDFDNDGFLDIIVSTWDHCESLRYFHNNGDGTFSDWTERAGLTGQLGGLNIIHTDYNNDGWMDLLVLRGAWLTPMRKSLLRNNGDGTFTDVTEEAGLAVPATSTNSAVWTDIDNDGLLELLVGVEHAPSQLFHNDGHGHFTDIAHAAGVDRAAFTKAVSAGDYDNDGFPDLYLSNYGEENFLYHNNGDGTFTELARRMHVEKPIASFPTWFFDYDNDGWLDIFVASFIHSVSEVIRSYLGLSVAADTARLYRNLNGTGFQDVAKEAGLDRVFMPMGANFGDINNDGFLDMYLGTGDPSYASLTPNVLFLNKDGKHFEDITASSGTGSLGKGHGVAIADVLNDGRPCIFESIGGAMPGDRFFCALYRSPELHNNWINVKLVGIKSNRAGVGARIQITVLGADHKPRKIFRDVNTGGHFGSSPLQQHVGVGPATQIDSLEILWPTSKTRQIFRGVRVNQFIEVHEFAKDYVKLHRRSIKV